MDIRAGRKGKEIPHEFKVKVPLKELEGVNLSFHVRVIPKGKFIEMVADKVYEISAMREMKIGEDDFIIVSGKIDIEVPET